MKLKKMLVLGFSVMVTGVVVLTGLLVLQEQIQSELFKVINRRQVSILLADELRQSSDDLTRMARTYVVTADPKYEKMYWDILAIRNGDKPRPEEYDRVYWDLVLTYGDKPRPNGKAIPLQQLMKEAGFTSEEFALLKEAQNNSDALVYTETIAMNAMKGLYEDKNGEFVKKGKPDYEMARRIMHDEKYHKDKYIIMEPIDRFLAEVKARTAQEVKDIENTEIAIHRVTLMLAGFAIILFIGVGYYVIRKTWAILGCEPSVFAEMAKRVTAGDLSFSMEDISSELKEGRKSGILSEAVSTMLEALKEQTKEINSTLASAANELSTTASQLAASTTETSSTINHVGGTVEEVRHIAQLANDRTSKVMEDAHSLRRVSVHGSTASQEAIDSMKLINTEMEKIAETIIHLSEQTQNIGEIVDAVNDIADQSNLLSINASIEASKAGEYGKGFAVVAQEMKELTEQSKVATSKIAAILGEIQQATGSAVMATERGGKAVNSGKELVSKAGLSIDELADGMEKSVQSVEQIGASSKEQLVGMDQLVDAIEDIKSATSQNVEGTTQLESAAIKLRNLVEQLGKKTEKANK